MELSEVNWILKQFSRQRKKAIEKYINFVREGAGLPSIWGDLQNQVFLGSDKFINKLQKEIKKKDKLNDIPRIQKRKIPKSLKYYSEKYKDQNKSILNAYLQAVIR